jgi:hypothetical protein
MNRSHRFGWSVRAPGGVQGVARGGAAAPHLRLADRQGYAVRPEGVELITVSGQQGLLFVEDRFLATGHGTRNAIHWPVSILGTVP